MKKMVFLMLMSSLFLTAEETLTLPENMVVEMAVANNLTLKTQGLDLETRKRQMDTRYNVFYPDLKVNGALSRANTPKEFTMTPYSLMKNPLSNTGDISQDYMVIPGAPVPVFEADPWTMVLGLEASLFISPAMFDGVEALVKNYELGKISLEKATSELTRDIRKAFYTTILLEEQLNLLYDNYRTLNARYEQTKRNYQNGLVAELTVLQIQVSLENFKPQITSLENILETSHLNLKRLMGMDLSTPIALEGEIEPEFVDVSFEEALNLALKENVDLKLLEGNKDLLEIQKQAKIHESFYPVMGLQFSMGTMLNGPFEGDNWSDFPDNFVDDTGSLTLFVNIPLASWLPSSSARMKIQETEDVIEKLDLQKKMAIDGMEVQLVQAVTELNKSREIQKGLALTVELAEKSLRLTEDAYNAGSKELLEVENSENEYKKAKVELLNEKFKYLSALLDLEYMLNTELLKRGDK